MALFLLGLLSLLAQVVLLRELNVAFFGVELVYLVALSVWLAATGAGALLGPTRGTPSPTTLACLLGGAALLVPADVAFIRGSRLLMGGVPGAYLPIERQAAVLLLSVAPVAFALGLGFRRAARLHVAHGGTLGGAYGIESIGAAAGGLGSTLLVKAGVQTFALAIGTAGGLLTALSLWRLRSRARALAVLPAVIAGLAIGQQAGIDRAMTRWTHPTLVETLDTPYARVTVTESAAQVAIFENDVLVFDSDTADTEELPHLAALHHPAPRRILLLGGVAERLDRALWSHAPERLDQVEIDGALVALAERHLEGAGRPRATRVIADPRAFLGNAGTYDVIVVSAPEPMSGLTNRLYTREFFEHCASRLAMNGVLALRLRMPENYLTRASVQRAASVVRSLGSVFPSVSLLPGASTTVIASRSELPTGATSLIDRWHRRRLDTRLITPAYLEYLFTNDRRARMREALASAEEPANTDSRPISYYFATVNWLSRFFPGLVGSSTGDWAASSRWPWTWGLAAAAVLGVAVALLRTRPSRRRAGLVLVAGCVGMTLETVMLLRYQTASGALFEDVGLLLTMFMAGSAAGAWLATRRRVIAARMATRGRAALILGGLVACSLVQIWVGATGLAGPTATAALLLVVGALVAGVFVVASQTGRPPDEREAGRLYGADLLGGCGGSLLASLVLVPLAGLDVTAGLVAALAVTALSLV